MESSTQPENDAESTVLDLTGCQLRDLTSLELPSTLTELDLTTNRLTALDPRISHLSNIQKLSFRQNLFNDDSIRPLSTWATISGLQGFLMGLADEQQENRVKPIIAPHSQLPCFILS